MESRRRRGDRVSISRCSNASEYTEALPIEIVLEILSRLPAKSVARCRCVSKQWASMLRHPDFTELFFTRSRARPQLLFVLRDYYSHELLFFSTPQPQNLDENFNPSPVAATFHMKVPYNNIGDIFSPIDGLVCFRDYHFLGEKDWATIICNPSTGQSCTLPKRINLRSFVGCDPIGKEFKLLPMTERDQVSVGHQVFTLGIGRPSRRMVQCGITHFPGREVICINGVLYYEAALDCTATTSMIACFDVRTETYSFIQLTEAVTDVLNDSTTLVNYNGSLALFVVVASGYMNTSFVMCVLEDTETHKWSKHTYELPFGLDSIVGQDGISFVGVTGANEIVFSSYHPSDLFNVTFTSFERNTFIRVPIQGMGATKARRVCTFLNHVENVKLMQVL